MYQEQILRPWFEALRSPLPDLQIVDGHLHMGTTDPAGYQADGSEIVTSLEALDGRGVVFPVKSVDGYGEANDDVLGLAARHPDRIVAFARIDPAADPVVEARRCIDQGAAGLKLHPRGDDFELVDDRLDGIFALASDLRLPLVVHAGVGDRSVGRQALDRARANPGARIVLAHVAVGAFEEVIPELHSVPNVLVDTSWWNVSDLWAAFCLAPPGQIVHGSDVPFNSPLQGALMSGRLALQAGLSSDQVRAVMGGTMERLLDRSDLPGLGSPPQSHDPIPPELERVYVTLCSAVVPMLAGEPPGQGLDLAMAACEAPTGAAAPVLESIGHLLDAASACEDLDPLRPLRTPGFDLVLTAALLSRTPDVALPEIGST